MVRTLVFASFLLLISGCPEEGARKTPPGAMQTPDAAPASGQSDAGGAAAHSGQYCIYTATHYTWCPELGSSRDEEERCIEVASAAECPPPPPKDFFGHCSHTYATVERELRAATSCDAALAEREQERCSRLGEGVCDVAECGDGIDNNRNGLVDCQEPMCLFSSFETRACLFPERSPGRCFNQHDDDGDGLSDCVDPDCADACAAEEGLEESTCWDTDGSGAIDNDGDGLANCEESVCADPRHYNPPCALNVEICDDLADNDRDGDRDCADSECSERCRTEEGLSAPTCEDGIDNDEDGLVDCAEPQCLANNYAWGCARPEICDDGIDNDRDHMFDEYEDDEDCR